jgi:hypothetical protein
MKSPVLALVALVVGIVAGSWIVRYPAVHRVVGRIFQLGELLALVGQRGIFEADVQARVQQKQYCSGITDEPLDPAKKIGPLDEVIVTEALRMVAGKLDDSDVPRGVPELEHEFADQRQFLAALRRSGVSQSQLGRLMTETIGGERWIEKQIAPRLAVSDAEAAIFSAARSSVHSTAANSCPSHFPGCAGGVGPGGNGSKRPPDARYCRTPGPGRGFCRTCGDGVGR